MWGRRWISEAEARLSLLEGRAGMLRGRMEELRGVLDSLRAERSRLNESVRLLRAEALRWREERDRANLEAAEIRGSLKLRYEELKERRSRLEELEAMLRERRRRVRPKREIRSMITRLEWEVSTTPTLEMLPRERELLERARALYEEFRECEELEGQRNMALMLLSEIKAIEIKIREYKEKLVKLREVSKERHEKMILIYGKAEEEKKRADNIHSKILENISEMKKVREELKKVLKEISMVKKEIREKNLTFEAEKKILMEERKKEIAEKARRKLESGGKISLEELKILFEEKEEDEDED